MNVTKSPGYESLQDMSDIQLYPDGYVSGWSNYVQKKPWTLSSETPPEEKSKVPSPSENRCAGTFMFKVSAYRAMQIFTCTRLKIKWL